MKGQKKLRTGITTGSCSAAAAFAAATYLLCGKTLSEVALKTPSGKLLNIPVTKVLGEDGKACFSVKKDSGDDPDVTNGIEIRATVSVTDEKKPKMPCFAEPDTYPGLLLFGGEGVGIVTRVGLEQEVGYPAINRVPRQQIFAAVDEVRRVSGSAKKLSVTIDIPEGKLIAEKTFNSELGIRDGLSVLGSTGVLEPMSEKAIIDTIAAEIGIRAAEGKQVLLVSPGNYGRRYMEEYLGLTSWDSVKCSNYVGDMIDLAVGHGFKKILLVGNIGKLLKLAAGIMNTHSNTADGRREIMVTHAALAGADREVLGRLYDAIGTEEMLDILNDAGLKEVVMGRLIAAIDDKLKKRAGGSVSIGAILFSESYGYLGETEDAGSLLQEIKEQ